MGWTELWQSWWEAQRAGDEQRKAFETQPGAPMSPASELDVLMAHEQAIGQATGRQTPHLN